MSADNERTSLMERLFGKRAGKEAAAKIAELIAVLDKAGLDRKELEKPKTKGILEDMAEQVDALLEGITDDAAMRSDLSNQIIATIMGTLANTSPAEEEPVAEEPPIEEMQDGEDEEDKLPEQFMELSRQVKELAAENHDYMEEMKAFIPAVIDMAGAVKELAPLIGKAEQLATLADRLTEVESLLKMQPRRASADGSTVVQNDELEKQIKRGTDGRKTELGILLKE